MIIHASATLRAEGSSIPDVENYIQKGDGASGWSSIMRSLAGYDVGSADLALFTSDDDTQEQHAQVSDETCRCSTCVGRRVVTDQPQVGFRGFQCSAASSPEQECDQEGESTEWVIQTAKRVMVDRFCHFSCKPDTSQPIGRAQVPCLKLDSVTVKEAQTSTGNGRGFLWRQNPLEIPPMTLSDVTAELPPTQEGTQ